MNNEKAKNAKRNGQKSRIRKPQSTKILMKLVGKIHEVVGVKVHYHEIEVCHTSSRFRRITNLSRRFIKLVEH